MVQIKSKMWRKQMFFSALWVNLKNVFEPHPKSYESRFMPSIQPQLNSSSIQLNHNLTSTKFQLNLNLNLNLPLIQPQAQIKLSLNLNLNLNSIWLWHKSNPILFWWVVEKFKNFTFVVNLASGFQTEVVVVYIFKFVKCLTK